MENGLVRKKDGELVIVPSVKGALADTTAESIAGKTIAGPVGAIVGGAIGGTIGLIFRPED